MSLSSRALATVLAQGAQTREERRRPDGEKVSSAIPQATWGDPSDRTADNLLPNQLERFLTNLMYGE